MARPVGAVDAPGRIDKRLFEVQDSIVARIQYQLVIRK
jgi:hypothetical protein